MKDLSIATIRVNKINNHVFAIWHGTYIEDQMKTEELIKIRVNNEIPSVNYSMTYGEKRKIY